MYIASYVFEPTEGQSMSARNRRSPCPIAATLDLLGDRWTLLVVRDLMFRGFREYGEFLNGGENIATNVLADRLKRLQLAGVVTRTVNPRDLKRGIYSLTEKGIDLMPIVVEMMTWGLRHCKGSFAPPEVVEALAKDREGFLADACRRLQAEIDSGQL